MTAKTRSRTARRRTAPQKPNARSARGAALEQGPYLLLYREAHAEGPASWVKVGRARSLAEAQDEIAAWAGPTPRHADLARIVGPSPVERLYFFDTARSAFVAVPKLSGRAWAFGGIPPLIRAHTWLDFWEGPFAMASQMALYFGGVQRERVERAVEGAASYVADRVPEHRADVGRALDRFRRREETPLEAGWFFRAVAGFESFADPVRREAQRRATASDDRDAWDRAEFAADRRLAPIVRAHVPLGVVLASAVGAADPDLRGPAFAPTRSMFHPGPRGHRKRNGGSLRRDRPEGFRWRSGGNL